MPVLMPALQNMKQQPMGCLCAFFRGMRLPCKHILRFLDDAEADMFAADLVAPRWTQEYNTSLNISIIRNTDIKATVGTPVGEKTVLTSNRKFRKATTKMQRLAGLMSEGGMPQFRQRMDLIDTLILMWEEQKTCTLVETVGIDARGKLHDGFEVLATYDEQTTQKETIEDVQEIEDVLPQKILQKYHKKFYKLCKKTQYKWNPQYKVIDLSQVSLPVKS